MRVVAGSCYDFFSGRASHPIRYASYLSFHTAGQIKTINAVRSILDVAGYAAQRDGIDYVNNVLGDVKVVLNFVKLPSEGDSWVAKCKKTQKSCRHLYTAFSGGQLEHRDWIDAGVRSAGLFKKTLTFIGDCFFKPVVFIGKFVDMGKVGKTMDKSWQVVSIVKSSIKITHGSGKLYLNQGTCSWVKTAKKVVEMVLEIGEMILTIFTFRSVRVHPVATIVLAVCKSIFGLAEAWLRTA